MEQLKSELETHKIRSVISKQVEQTFQEANRKVVLREQLKEIQKQLGMTDEKNLLMNEFQMKLSKLTMPPKTKELVESEIQRLGLLESTSHDYILLRNYLELILSLPWLNYLPENQNLDHAKKILEEDHFGLEDIKQRILEFISIRNLHPHSSGKIICLHGPPGSFLIPK